MITPNVNGVYIFCGFYTPVCIIGCEEDSTYNLNQLKTNIEKEIHTKMNYDDQTKNRIKRIEGQIRGLLKAMEEGKDCRDVVTQISAARSALDRTAALIVSKNLEACIREERETEESSEDVIKEAVDLLVKSR